MTLLRIISCFLFMLTVSTSLQARLDLKSYYRHAITDKNISDSQRIAYIDSLLKLSPNDSQTILELKARTYFDQGRCGDASAIMQQLLDSDISRLPANIQCDIYLLAIRCYKWHGNYEMMIDVCEKLLTLNKPDSLLYRNIDALSAMYDLNRVQLNSGVQFLNQSEKMLNDARKRNVADSVIKKMEVRLLFMKMSQETACDSLQSALKYAAALDAYPMSDQLRATVDLNIGYIYLKANELEIAEKYFRDIINRNIPCYSTGLAVINLTHLLNMQHRYNETVSVFSEFGHFLRYLGRDRAYTMALENYAAAYAGKGDYENAYNYILSSKLRVDSIYSNINTFQQLHNYRISELQQNITDADARIVRDRKIIISSFAMLLIVAIVSLAVILTLHRRIERQKRLRDTEAKRCEELALKLNNANSEISEISRSSSAMTLQIEQFQRIISDVKGTVDSKTLTSVKKLNNIKDILHALNITEDTWQKFSAHFEKISPSFFTTLSDRCEDITPNDMRLAAYIKMNMTTKEIAELTSRTTRSVDTARYRLAKKLRLPENTTLHGYLHSI